MENSYLFKNAGKLLVGNIGSGGIAFVTLIFVARLIGAEGLGQFAVITALVGVIGTLINFRPVQMMIYYGVKARSEGDQDGYSRILRLGIFVDVTSALLSFGVIFIFMDLFAAAGWVNAELKPFILVYALTVLFNVSGACEAVLQIYARFGSMAIRKFITALFTLVFVVVSFLVDGGLWYVVISYTAGSIAGNLFLASAAISSLRRDSVTLFAPLHFNSIGGRFPGIWGFLVTTNLNSSIRMASKEGDILVVDTMLSAEATGVYRLAKSFALAVQQINGPMATVIFPMLSEKIAANDYRQARSVARRSSLIIGTFTFGIWILFFILGPVLIGITIGSDFADAHGVLVWYILALVVAAFAFPLQPMMLSFGRPHLTFWVHIIATVIYFSSLVLLIRENGLAGSGQAYLIYYSAWSGMMLLAVSTLMRKAIQNG